MKKKPKKSCRVSWRISTLILAAFCALLPSGAIAAPAISGFSGTVSNGQTVTITGSGFGATGPTIFVYDEFEKGQNGSLVSTAAGSATIRNWTYISAPNGSPTYSTEYSFSGLKSMRNSFNRGSGGSTPQVCLNNLGGTTEVFYTFWQMLPTGRDVPGTNNVDGPNWKFVWLYGSSFPMSDYTHVILTNNLPDVQGASLGPASDDLNSPARWSGRWFSSGLTRNVWQRHTAYYRGSTTNGAVDLFIINKDKSRVQVANVSGVPTMHSGETWYNLNFPGYGRNDSNSVVYYDDIYVAVGPNCRSRIEIGNNPSYANCTNLSILTPTAWSSSSITATVRQGSFTSGSAYLFVIDSTGAPSAGYPISIGGSGGGTPPPPACTTALNSSSASFDSSTHTGSIAVTASSSTCSWTSTSNASWITITAGSSGTGSGTVQYSVAQNTSTSQRTGTMTVAGATFTVLQSAGGTAACTFTVTPGSVSLSSLAQTGSISVSSSTSSCSWSAVSNSEWITISSGSSGTRTGSGTVQYSVAQNTSTSQRTGTITVAGKSFTVQQAAGTVISCAFSLDKNMATFDYLAKTGTINVTASTSSCPWTAKSNAAWITITSGSSGTGSGTVVYSIAVNTSSTQRSSTITVGGITYTIYQAAYGHKKPHPPRNLRTAS